MRKLVNVPKSKQQLLCQQFEGFIDLYQHEEDKTPFKKGALSVFKEWLSNEDAVKLMDNGSVEQHQAYDEALHQFIIELYHSYQCYVPKLRGTHNNTKLIFKKITADKFVNAYLSPTHYKAGNLCRFILVFPELDIVYFENCDFTHVFYYRDEKHFSVIELLANKHNLYLI